MQNPLAWIIEDSGLNRRVLTRVIESFGFEVRCFSSGSEVVNAMNDMWLTVPEIIFCDLMMPKMSGLELIRRIRQNSNFEKSVIIVISAVADSETVEKAKAMNVSGYIIKPSSAARILKALDHALNDFSISDDLRSQIEQQAVKTGSFKVFSEFRRKGA